MISTPQVRSVPDIVTELPGPRARAHIEFDHAWTSPSLPRAYPLVPVRGEGCEVEDVDGNLFLDFAAGIAVNSTGHAHPRVSAAIAKQASELIQLAQQKNCVLQVGHVERFNPVLTYLEAVASTHMFVEDGVGAKLARLFELAASQRIPGRFTWS